MDPIRGRVMESRDDLHEIQNIKSIDIGSPSNLYPLHKQERELGLRLYIGVRFFWNSITSSTLVN